VFHDRRYAYFAHPYNATWRNERAVEIPLAREFLARFPGGVGLEVGNVMSHYGPIRHTVLDKYEADPRVVAVDVVDFHPPQRFDYILSISTLEHVGRDEVPCEPEKSPRALAHLRALVQPDGRLFVTCPLGYNPALDRAVLESSPVPLVEGFLRRQATANRFDEIDKESAGRLLASSQKCSLLWIAEFGAVAGRQNDS
jgi:hypothetical protein